MAEKMYYVPLTIANAGTTSTVFNCRDHADPDIRKGYRILGLVRPGLTGTALTIQQSVDGSTYVTQKDISGNDFTIVADGTGAYHDFLIYDGDPLPYVKLVSNGAEAAERSLTLVISTRE